MEPNGRYDFHRRCSDIDLVSLSSDGLTVASGGHTKGENAHVRVLEYNQNKWVLVGSTVELEGITDILSMVLSSDGLVVSVAVSIDQQGTYVHVYKNDEGTWSKIGSGIAVDMKLKCLSLSLSFNGSVVAIGSPSDNGGYVRVFEHKENSWTYIGTQIGINIGEGSCLSISLSSDGQTIAIGPYSKGGFEFWGDLPGYVLIFKFNEDKWDQVGDRITGLSENSVTYTQSLYLSADASTIGFWELLNTDNTIYFVVMHNYDDAWVQVGKGIEAGSRAVFGSYAQGFAVLSLDGSTVAVGSFWKSFDKNTVYASLYMTKLTRCNNIM